MMNGLFFRELFHQELLGFEFQRLKVSSAYLADFKPSLDPCEATVYRWQSMSAPQDKADFEVENPYYNQFWNPKCNLLCLLVTNLIVWELTLSGNRYVTLCPDFWYPVKDASIVFSMHNDLLACCSFLSALLGDAPNPERVSAEFVGKRKRVDNIPIPNRTCTAPGGLLTTPVRFYGRPDYEIFDPPGSYGPQNFTNDQHMYVLRGFVVFIV